ncbi:MAG: hypothetical protein LBG60_03765 [Bifidobacteriaceae bacterium]|jgi:hypothetical protein|nr:hypothetical protein [Bifidobacteriaceae bacterium]
MISEPPSAVFLDADVLAAPVTRTVILVASQQDAPPFRVRWSGLAEAEADRHLRPGQRLVSQMRERFDWGPEALTGTACELALASLEDTDPKDRHVAAAAHAAGIGVIVTRNVRHFGRRDLAALSLSAVDPDWFLAVTLTSRVYTATLEDVCSARARDPRTPEALHAALAREHPRLFDAMRPAFPGAEPARCGNRPPADLFRGVRCVACGSRDGETLEGATGVCAGCGKERRSPSAQAGRATAAGLMDRLARGSQEGAVEQEASDVPVTGRSAWPGAGPPM